MRAQYLITSVFGHEVADGVLVIYGASIADCDLGMLAQIGKQFDVELRNASNMPPVFWISKDLHNRGDRTISVVRFAAEESGIRVDSRLQMSPRPLIIG